MAHEEDHDEEIEVHSECADEEFYMESMKITKNNKEFRRQLEALKNELKPRDDSKTREEEEL